MLTITVAAAVGLTCAAFNIAPVSGQAEFGDANHWFTFKDIEPQSLQTKLDAARSWFGQIDPIGHRRIALPGTVKEIDYRAQQPDGPYGKPLLRLRSGRYPTSASEAAITDGVASALGIKIGSTVDLDGTTRTVVGTVENPSDLGDEFVLLPPSAIGTSQYVTMLVNASEARVEAFRPPGDTGRVVGARDAIPQDVLAGVLTLVVTTLVLFLVALIAAASFTVVAQRRLPQLGMMAAVGANEKQLRMSMVVTGAVTGAVAAVVGTVIGLAGWIVLAPSIGQAVGYRIDALDVPWALVIAAMLLAVGASTAAAWWPARAVSRVPAMVALSGRPPAPRPLHRSTSLAVGLLAGGIVCLALSTGNEQASSRSLALLFIGMVGVLAGILLLCPLAIQALAKVAGKVPVASRLALRDLSRYRARSGAALAAIALALGMAVTVVATAAAARNNIGLGNLSSTQVLLRGSDLDLLTLPSVSDIKTLQQGADAITAVLPKATATRLDVATNANEPVRLTRKHAANSFEDLGAVFVASPTLLSSYGLDANDLAGHDVVTNQVGALQLMWPGLPRSAEGQPGSTLQSRGDLPDGYSSLPGALISTDALAARGWQAQPSGQWLIETARRPNATKLKAARVLAAQYGLRLETRDTHGRLTNITAGAIAVGVLLALAILGMTIGLIRSESMGEMRTLTATGATRSTRRAITAVTAAALAALGAILGMIGAYIGLAAGRLSHLLPLPVGQLVLIAVGTPVIAAAAGWLFAGREPAAIARRPLD